MRLAWSVFGLVLPAMACLSSSSPGGSGSSGSSSGAASGSASGSSSGSGGGPDAAPSGDDAGGLTVVPLTPTGTGYVDNVNLGIVGSWYVYGDGLGQNGAPPGNCESVGMHPASACSSVTSPAPSGDAGSAGFPPNAQGAMCLSGTAAQIVGTPPDYSNIFGIGLGLDFNNMGGTKEPYDAAGHKVVGVRFTISGLPASPGIVRVELPFPGTDASGDAYSEIVAPGTTQMTIKWTDPAFGPSFPPPQGTTEPTFDPSKVESIQFHVVTVTSAAIPVTNLCVSGLAALVSN
jgi:hypothetical protein